MTKEMGRLADQGKSCAACPGFCCSNEHNSMQVDPVQALELLSWLEGQNRLDEELGETLDKAIIDFRLDKEFFVGRGREFRRHYTCPFYNGKTKGCTVSRAAKPYGCLGFNPLEEKVAVPGKCASNLKTLIARESRFSSREQKANDLLKTKLGLYWDKKNLPFALKDMLRAMTKKAVSAKKDHILKQKHPGIIE